MLKYHGELNLACFRTTVDVDVVLFVYVYLFRFLFPEPVGLSCFGISDFHFLLEKMCGCAISKNSYYKLSAIFACDKQVCGGEK